MSLIRSTLASALLCLAIGASHSTQVRAEASDVPAPDVSATISGDLAVVSIQATSEATVSLWAAQSDGSLRLVGQTTTGNSQSATLVVPVDVSAAIDGGLLVITTIGGRDIRDWLE